MIFSPPLYGKVLRGEKTQTRRLALPSHPKHKYQVGKRIAVQRGRGIHSEAHILLTDVRREMLSLLDYDAARAEGFKTQADFKTYWVELHDAAWAARWEAGQQKTPEGQTVEYFEDVAVPRFDTRWAPKEVWVLTFEIDRSEQPIMLMQGSPLTDGGKARLMSNRKIPPGRAKSSSMDEYSLEARGYTQSGPRAMPREPEPVDAASQKLYAREGHQGWAARELAREADRERLGLEERLRLARSEARAAGVDVSSQEDSILRRIKSLESKVRKRA